MNSVSIIIVNYQLCDLLRDCLNSIYRWEKELNFEIIVVDNASPNQDWKCLMTEFPEVNFVESSINLGFSRANNWAAQLAKSDYLLLLNPDTQLMQPTLKKLLYFSENKENLGVVGVRMHDAYNRFLPESKRSVPNLSNSFSKLFLSVFQKNYSQKKSYYRGDIAETDIAEVDVITGAFLWVKKQDYTAIGGLDERYFMYGEDIDFCYSLLLANKTNYYYGEISLLHHKGESTVKDLKYLSYFYGAMALFLAKYYKKKHRLAYCFLILGLKLKHQFEIWKLPKK